MSKLTPALHKPVPLQTKVRVPSDYLGKEVTGLVGGIASQHVVFQYIVVLDEPYVFDGEVFTALTVPGSHLMDASGSYAWRLEA